MSRHYLLSFCLAFALALSLPAAQAFNEPDVRGQESTQPTDPKNMDNIMGYYEGTYASFDTPDHTAQAMVVAEGNRTYRVVLMAQPMEGMPGFPLHFEVPATLGGATLNIFGTAGDKGWQGTLTDGVLVVNKMSYGGQFVLKKVDRHSPTEGMKPPKGAIVLLADGQGAAPNLDAWKNPTWKINEDGSMQKGAGAILTKQSFGDVKYHMEFRTPYEPMLREQMRGNSGLFFCDAYEVQVLDSFGVIPGAGDCGSIYNTAAPKAIAAYPPLAWQTYDIEFRAPRLNDDGSLKEPGRITVEHNGIKIHDQQEISHSTVDPTKPPVAKGPIQLQDHGNIVRYRNIWVLPLD
jgi:hypothetical protein